MGAEVFIEEPGYASVLGRVSRCTLEGAISGYQLRLYDTGKWELREDTDKGVIASGQVPCGLNTWHRLDLSFQDDLITAAIDQQQAAAVKHKRFVRGLAGLGNGYNIGQYDNFEIAPLTGVPLVATSQAASAREESKP